mmetsp:Transcript_15638/g.20670  ORF Transcript_15638/g.20670 Transcript_15638/m.20670 type:complete len:123 (+) Transcript_15638:55-423(+)
MEKLTTVRLTVGSTSDEKNGGSDKPTQVCCIILKESWLLFFAQREGMGSIMIAHADEALSRLGERENAYLDFLAKRLLDQLRKYTQKRIIFIFALEPGREREIAHLELCLEAIILKLISLKS